METEKPQAGATKTPPGVEAVVRKYERPKHPFGGMYTRVSEPVEVGEAIPGDMRQLCLAAKRQEGIRRVKTYAFFEGHRYDLSMLDDVMGLESEARKFYRRDGIPHPVLLKAEGHGPCSREAVVDVYHAFVGNPEIDVETVENGDWWDCKELCHNS